MQNLNPQQLAAINIGAINAEQTGYFCDSLSTGAKVAEIKENLSDYYGIVDRNSAFETLEWLYTDGHRVYFDVVKKAVNSESENLSIVEFDVEEVERIKAYVSNLKETLPELQKEEIVDSKIDLANVSIAAWDMGRLVLVARCCFDAGYLSEQETWHYINNAYRTCKEYYSSWKEVANGYIIGRAMWSGMNMALVGIIAIAQGLLQDEKSPWKLYVF